MKKVIVVGGGIGGLCSAIRLLKKGYYVEIFEKEDSLGGKVNVLYSKKARFDLTASILMTPSIYTDIFKSVGKNYKDYFELIELDTTYRVSYYDNSTYDFYSDLSKMGNILESMDKGLFLEYLDFLNSSYKKYSISKEHFLTHEMTNIGEILNLESISNLIKINPPTTVDKFVNSKIKNEKLRNYIIFQAMYIGENPYNTSNLYTLIPSISHTHGLWIIKGGFYNYIKALERLIYDLGGKIKLCNDVQEILIKNKKAYGVLCNDAIYKSDIVVCNVDFPYAIKNLFKDELKEGIYNLSNIDSKNYSCSIFIIYLGLNKKYEDLKVNNIYISESFRESIESAFNGEIPKNPSLYLYSPSAMDDSVLGEYKQILNIVLRVPNLLFKDIKWDKQTILKTRNLVINQIKNIKGLYFIGSSTHPGNGVSVIIDGSKLVSQIIENDYKQ